jgi:hypothetical protein
MTTSPGTGGWALGRWRLPTCFDGFVGLDRDTGSDQIAAALKAFGMQLAQCLQRPQALLFAP